MNQPEIRGAIELLRRYKTQKSGTDAGLAISMTAFGWTWTEGQLVALFRGTMKPSEEMKEFIKRYLLNRYYLESLE